MDIVLKAISFAARAHRNHMRADGATPYFAHPVRVMLSVVRELGEADPETLAAAALHDTVEDTTTDFDALAGEFGATVASYVALLTKDKRLPEKEREDRYFAALAAAPRSVKLCKIADTLDNLRDAKTGRGGNLEKTVGKARKLFELFGGDPAVAAALGVLRREVGA